MLGQARRPGAYHQLVDVIVAMSPTLALSFAYLLIAAAWLFLPETIIIWLLLGLTPFVIYRMRHLDALITGQRRALDIAEKFRQAQGNRLHTLSLLSAIADASDDAIFAKDAEGRYLLFNHGAERYTGKQAAEALGKDDRWLFPAEQAATLMKNDQAILLGNSTATFKEKLQTVLGEITFMAIKGPLYDADGKSIGLFGISRDISLLEKNAEALRYSEKRFADIARASADWIWEVDAQWHYVYASSSVENLLGYSVAEITGQSLVCFIAPDDEQRIQAQLDEAARGRLPIKDLDTLARAKNGSMCHVRINAIPVTDDNGKLKGYRGLVRNITDEKYSETFLRHQAEDLSQRNTELERFNKAMVGREIDMIQLKNTINELSVELGRDPPYGPDLLTTANVSRLSHA